MYIRSCNSHQIKTKTKPQQFYPLKLNLQHNKVCESEGRESFSEASVFVISKLIFLLESADGVFLIS